MLIGRSRDSAPGLAGGGRGHHLDQCRGPVCGSHRSGAIGAAWGQVTLQLTEPGTIWCQAAELDTVGAPVTCQESAVQGQLGPTGGRAVVLGGSTPPQPLAL